MVTVQNEYYYSCGIDVGTTTFHYTIIKVFKENSALTNINQAIEYTIEQQSPIFLTPYRQDSPLIDEDSLLALFDQSLLELEININLIHTGALIITGMAVQQQNAAAIVAKVKERIPNLISTITGARLEALLAAKGARIDRYSLEFCKTIANIDIGGGTSNIAIYKNGEIVDLASLWIGGKSVMFTDQGQIIAGHAGIKQLLQQGLSIKEIATRISKILWQYVLQGKRCSIAQTFMDEPFISYSGELHIDSVHFSGGVGEWINQKEHTGNETHHDFGYDLANAILAEKPDTISLLHTQHPIRATVLGAGIHSVQISGDTIFVGDSNWHSLTDIPLLTIRFDQLELLNQVYLQAKALYEPHQIIALYILSPNPFSFLQIEDITHQITALVQEHQLRELVILMNQNAGRILGYKLKLILGEIDKLIVIDHITAHDCSYIDIGMPFSDHTLPVTVKHFVL